jgi:hypothetical protein
LEPSPQKKKNVTSSKKKIVAVAVTVLMIALTATVASALMLGGHTSSTQTNDQSSQITDQSASQSWITKGAYATYEGQETVESITVSFTAKMEIVDLNQTHIQVQTTFNMSTPFGDTENSTTTWVSRENMTYQPDGLTLNGTYNTQVTLPNIGTRSCTVYEYSNQDISATYYVDNSIQWPIEMIMTSPIVDGQSYSMNINLVDSNIPGL